MFYLMSKDTKNKNGAIQVRYEPIPQEAEQWAKALLDASFEVHTILGAGLLERIYENALCYELTLRGVPFERQKQILVPYKDFQIEGLRLDLLIGGFVIAEIKPLTPSMQSIKLS